MLVTCASCKADTAEPYKVKDYLDDLSDISGIGISEDTDEIEELKEWEIIDEEDEEVYDKALDYDYLSKTVKNLLDDESCDLNDYIPEEYKKKNGDPPEAMKMIYDILHEKHIENAAAVKGMLSLYK